MAISTPCYCTRENVKSALDIKQTARNDGQVDRAIDTASRSVEGLCNRVFYPTVATRKFDWPNYQYAYPWRLWLDANELAEYSTAVVSSGGTVISAASIFFEPYNYGPPYTRIELDRSTTAAFGVNPTPQRDISIAGVFGYWTRTMAAGTLAAAMTDTTGTSASVTDSVSIGVGDNILVGTERMLVTNKTMASTSQTQQSGLTTASAADVTLGVTTGSTYVVGETLLLDSERVLVVDISSNALTVKRAYDGTVLAAHTGATIYGLRTLTVQRGALGTTAATHSNSASVSVALVPGLVRDLSVAYAVVQLTNEPGAYARTQGSGEGASSNVGYALADLEDRCNTAYGRKARQRVI